MEETVITYLPVAGLIDLVNILGDIACLWFNIALFPWFTYRSSQVTKMIQRFVMKVNVSMKSLTVTVKKERRKFTMLIGYLMRLLCCAGCFVQC